MNANPIVEEEKYENKTLLVKILRSGLICLFYIKNGPFEHMGQPLSFNGNIDGHMTPICFDTGAGANVINTNYYDKAN